MKKILKLETCTMDEITRLMGNHEENIHLLEEAIQCDIIVRGNEIVLNEGDSIIFDSNHRHAMIALNDKKAKFLAVIM